MLLPLSLGEVVSSFGLVAGVIGNVFLSISFGVSSEGIGSVLYVSRILINF